MNNALGQIVTVLTAIVGIAILAVLVSKRSQTPQVIESVFGGFSKSIGAAVSPIMGGGNIL